MLKAGLRPGYASIEIMDQRRSYFDNVKLYAATNEYEHDASPTSTQTAASRA